MSQASLEHATKTKYAELHCISNYSFLRGASHPEELVKRASKLGYDAIAITDECSLSGVVKAHLAAKNQGIKLIIGSEFVLQEGLKLVLLAPNRKAYGELSALISLARRRSPKGDYSLKLSDLKLHIKNCLCIWLPFYNLSDHFSDKPHHQKLKEQELEEQEKSGSLLSEIFNQPSACTHSAQKNLWIGLNHCRGSQQSEDYLRHYQLAKTLNLPMLACGNVHMHSVKRKALQDTLSAIRLNTRVQKLGRQAHSNSERYLRSIHKLQTLFPAPLLAETLLISKRCCFSLDELRYQYPKEVVPEGFSPESYLLKRVNEGSAQRWPQGVPIKVQANINKELRLIKELNYEYYFLTVYDIVQFARSRNILCQGRGSAANSVVCYCLFITEVSPTRISLLFERFLTKERHEPPDIDVDFEHERREEVIQYIYKKYSRERAALVATLITYRARSAVRDVGKALGFDALLIEQLVKSLAWWDRSKELKERFQEHNMADSEHLSLYFIQLVKEILGFPRHLSQHVGGFLISAGPISELVPVENASMADRTVIQWDKDDIEALGLLKVDVLALGMLTAIRKCLESIQKYDKSIPNLQSIPENDTATYDMLCRGDSLGVFQVESRAQMSMLPRLRPRCFYDLVIEVAIVRPGPIQGDMVHPYLRRREGSELVTYPSKDIQSVLERTLGVPIFQEQVIQLAMVAAGFSGGEADQLRRAMASWGKNGNLLQFEDKLIDGMLLRGYSEDFSRRLFEQIKGFGGYGFPESHSASFALLVYVSAWLKCHHPAAFYCAIMNCQPMGFYSPSQLIQDARRQGLTVEKIDVTYSNWNHVLNIKALKSGNKKDQQVSIVLGMRLVKELSQMAAERIIHARRERAFTDIADLIQRAKLNQKDISALANANALKQFSDNRYRAHWDILSVKEASPLFHTQTQTQISPKKERLNTEQFPLPIPNEADDMFADYQSTGLTLGRHPMALLRQHSIFKHCKRHIELQTLNNGRFVRIAGLVTGRQRPGSASGVIFLTLEDETGNTNVIIWKDLQSRFRQALLGSKLLLVKGIMECKNEVTHVIAGELIDYSHLLEDLAIKSRDFH